MISKELQEEITNWHQSQGGHAGKPAPHALRMLREMVELCVACGADGFEIGNAVLEEIQKANAKGELTGKPNTAAIPEEAADVGLLFTTFLKYTRIDLEGPAATKLAVCKSRLWEADHEGVLWRPGNKAGQVK